MTNEELQQELLAFDPEMEVIIEVLGKKGAIEGVDTEILVDGTSYIILNDFKES